MTTPHRIVQVVQHLRPGGIETLVLDLQRLSGAAEVHVVSLEGEANSACAAWERLRFRANRLHFLRKKPGWHAATLLGLLGLLRELKPDAVHTHHVGPLIYGGLAARLAGVRRVVHTEHDAWHLEQTRRRLLQDLVLRIVRPRLVADSQTVADAIRQALPWTQPEVVRNGIDTQRFAPSDRAAARRLLGLPADARIVGCAARMQPVKGHRFLLDALARLPGDVHLALAGDGPLEQELREHAGRLDIADRVHFLGMQSEMPRFYHALDVFCLASLAEGMPLSPLEAQACGVPVVVTAVGGASETVCPRSGHAVAPSDPAGLAAAIAAILGSEHRTSPRAFVLAEGCARKMANSYLHFMAPA